MKFRALLLISLIAGALQAASYSYVTSSEAVLVPGTADIGNHCDDCTTTVSLPFSYMLYGTLYNSVVVSSNGNLQFTGDTRYLGSNGLNDPNLGIAILGYQGDLRTNSASAATGIFTSLSGVGPNQIFNIEWRNTYYGRSGSADWEIRLYEGQQKFDLIYASTADNALSETIGVQVDADDFTEFSSNFPSISNGEMISFTAVPEPATAALFTLGGGLLLASGFLKKRLRN